jgi:predicted phosphodiesterase
MMPPIAVISDIHGNLEALEAVLEDIAAAGIDEIYSLGDNIGYGPDPETVLQRLLARGIPSVLGNHELAVMDPAELDWFNPVARQSLRKTVEMLSAASIAAIKTFPAARVVEDLRFVHGFPPDSPVTYLFQASEEDLLQCFTQLAESICFTGHTHYPEIIAYADGQLARHAMDRQRIQLDSASRYLINVGSVGQPRDGNNNAKYVILDRAALTVELRYVPYDIESVVHKILAAGLPEAHALRLR